MLYAEKSVLRYYAHFFADPVTFICADVCMHKECASYHKSLL